MNRLFWKILIIHFINVEADTKWGSPIGKLSIHPLCAYFSYQPFPAKNGILLPWCHVGYTAILIFWNQYVPHPLVTIASGHNTLGGFTCVSSLQLLCHISCLVHFLVVLETLSSPRSKTPFFPLMVTFGLHLTRIFF